MSKAEAFKTFDTVVAATKTIIAERSECEWYLGRMREYAEGLFARAPFKAGDRVKLVATPEINEKTSWGWLGYKSLLIKNAVATVTDVDFRDGKFNAMLIFDNDDSDDKARFCFWESQIEVARTADAGEGSK